MGKKELFTFKEALRNIRRNFDVSIHYFSYLTFCDLILIVFFIISINTHYLSQVFLSRSIIYAKYLLYPIVPGFDVMKLILFIVFIIFSLFIYLINRSCLDMYLHSYRYESNIVLKLKVDIKFIKYPIIYTGLIINFISVISAVLIIIFIYKYLSKIILIGGYSLLSYSCFDISLFTFLLILSTALVIISGYGIFKKTGL